MPSSTSSSKAEAVYERPVVSLGRTGWLAVVLALLLMVLWDLWVRSEGVTPGYRNSDGQWAEQRRRINNGEGDAWVFIGSSRTLFNLQLDVWEEQDGRSPIQLALEGSAPVKVLEGLANDEDFTGKLIVGVAPGLFFSGFEYRRAAMNRFDQESPTQWFGNQVSMLVEPYLAFYEDDYSLPTILRRQPLFARDGVSTRMDVRKLSNTERNRNTRMWSRLETDTQYRDLARSIWAQGWTPLAERPESARERVLSARTKQIGRAASAAKKLKTRGVDVVFIQMPYEGHYAKSEPDFAPRELTWDVVLEKTGALGLHFKDYEEMQGYALPEWSHMTGAEADRFTAAFHGLVKRELAAHKTNGESQ